MPNSLASLLAWKKTIRFSVTAHSSQYQMLPVNALLPLVHCRAPSDFKSRPIQVRGMLNSFASFLTCQKTIRFSVISRQPSFLKTFNSRTELFSPQSIAWRPTLLT